MPQLEQQNQQEILETSKLTDANDVGIDEALNSIDNDPIKKEIEEKIEKSKPEDLFKNKDLLEKIWDNFDTKDINGNLIIENETMYIFKKKLSEYAPIFGTTFNIDMKIGITKVDVMNKEEKCFLRLGDNNDIVYMPIDGKLKGIPINDPNYGITNEQREQLQK